VSADDQTDQQDTDQTDGQVDDAQSADQQTDDQGNDQLGDAGKQALDRMKAERNTARAALREFKALGLSVDEIKSLQKPAAKDDDAPNVEEIRAQARAEAKAEAARDRVVDKIEATARGFADPEDAVAILLRSRPADDFLDGDKIDVGEIEDALAELLEKRPYLAAAQGSQRRFQGSSDGGARKDKPLTLADRIEQAEKAGDVKAVMRLKSAQAIASNQ
jgi:hypothetical protein